MDPVRRRGLVPVGGIAAGRGPFRPPFLNGMNWSLDLARLLAGFPASALALTKQLFYQLDGQSVEQGVVLGARINALARQTPEFREAIGRFLART